MRRMLLIVAVAGIGLVGPADATAKSIDQYVDAIRRAEDPSAAVSAYAGALAVDRNNVRLHEAYIRRMLELDRAELTSVQVRRLLTIDADNGLAWAGTAVLAARAGRMPDAVSAITRSVSALPKDPFVLHTAGQFVAWYDQTDPTTVPQATRTALEKLRRDRAGENAFAAGYQAAAKAFVKADDRELEPKIVVPEPEIIESDEKTVPIRIEVSVERSTGYSDPYWCYPVITRYVYVQPYYYYWPRALLRFGLYGRRSYYDRYDRHDRRDRRGRTSTRRTTSRRSGRRTILPRTRSRRSSTGTGRTGLSRLRVTRSTPRPLRVTRSTPRPLRVTRSSSSFRSGIRSRLGSTGRTTSRRSSRTTSGRRSSSRSSRSGRTGGNRRGR